MLKHWFIVIGDCKETGDISVWWVGGNRKERFFGKLLIVIAIVMKCVSMPYLSTLSM